MPALSDGRCFTNYLAACQYDQILMNKYNVASEPAYRNFLQMNAMLAQQETRKLHVCAFAFDKIDTGPTLAPSPYVTSTFAPLRYSPAAGSGLSLPFGP